MLTFPDFDPIIFEIGPLAIRWYGLTYVVGFVLAWWLARRRCQRADSPVNAEQVDDLMFYGMLGVILGGRIGYALIYGTEQLLSDPLYLIKITQGGMSFHGGLAGVMIAMWLYGRKLGHTIWRMTDFIGPMVPVGLGSGRIGNFINGELWGRPAEGVAWAMRVLCNDTPARRDLCEGKLGLAPDVLITPPLHPSMLYEAILEGLVLFVLLWWFSSRARPYLAVSGGFLAGYGVFRFVVEFYRMPDLHLGYLALDWLTMGQILSVPMIVAGAIMLLMSRRTSGEAKA